MKKLEMLKITVILLMLVGSFYSCQSKNEVNRTLSDEQISFNLSKDGEIDPTLLIGEWNLVKFAHTTDGNKTSDVVDILRGRLIIPFAPTPIEKNEDERWRLDHSNSNWFICSLNENLIKLELRGSTYMLGTPEEDEIVNAFINAYSFVIKDEKLIIYFAGIENKNLLILKRDKP